MSQLIQINPDALKLANWRTTLIGIFTAVGGGLYQQYLNGGLTWPSAIALAVWAIFCYLVPDAATNKNGAAQLQALIEQVAGLKAQLPVQTVQARTDAPATTATGQALAPPV